MAKKQNNMDLFQDISCFVFLVMILVLPYLSLISFVFILSKNPTNTPRFHVVSKWNTRGVFVGNVVVYS